MRVGIPKQLTTDQNELLNIERLAQTTEEINTLIRSRENFRMFNSSMSNFLPVMTEYDKQLEEKLALFTEMALAVEAGISKGK